MHNPNTTPAQTPAEAATLLDYDNRHRSIVAAVAIALGQAEITPPAVVTPTDMLNIFPGDK